MKSPIKTFALLSSAALLSLSALTAVETDPVGYRTSTIQSGNTPFAPSLVNSNDFVGTIDSLAESTETTTVGFAGTPLTGLDFSEASALEGGFPKYYLEVTEPGATEGYAFDIVSNDSSSVSVVGLLSTGFSLVGDEQIAIRKHITVGDLFDGATGLTGFADSIKFFNDDGSVSILFWDGTKWTPNFSDDASLKPVYPGNGFMATFNGDVTVTVTGSVKTTATKVPLYAGAVNFIASLAPSDTDVDGLNAVSQLAAFADSIKLFTQDGNLNIDGIYFTDGTKMTTNFVDDDGADPVDGSTAFVVSVGTDKYLTIPAAY